MASGSHASRSLCMNIPVYPAGELDELADVQSSVRESNIESNKAPIPPETPTSPLVSPLTKDPITRFIKVFMETTLAQALAEQ